ncbi:MAG: LCP family protein [Peptococcaceae bacterium]|nr:LCP family protein [Peptococcaceae bacterium]
MTRTRRKLKRKTPLIICGVLLLVFVAGGIIMTCFPEAVPDTITTPGTEGKRLNVLLLGIDARQGETMARTDTMILASYDPKTKQVSLLSIPRDTRVAIPGHGMDKINSASIYGGPDLSMKVVSSLLGIQVKYYVLTNFSGFKDIVDALGGVTLDVEQNMYHEDETDGGVYQISLSKGVQRLNGDKALQYVRYRDYALGDIDRTKHQQKFLMALGKEMLQPSTITKLPKLIPEINKYVKTNLGVSDMVKMASAMKNNENYNMLAQTLPGRPIDIDGVSYWGVDPAEAKQTLAKLFSGEAATEVVLNTPLTGQYAAPQTTSTQSTSEEDKEGTPAAGKQQAGSKTQQGQSGSSKTTTTKPGQTTGNSSGGTSGSGGATVIITPIEPGGSGTGTATGKTPSGSKTSPDTGTGKTGTSDTSGATI